MQWWLMAAGYCGGAWDIHSGGSGSITGTGAVIGGFGSKRFLSFESVYNVGSKINNSWWMRQPLEDGHLQRPFWLGRLGRPVVAAFLSAASHLGVWWLCFGWCRCHGCFVLEVAVLCVSERFVTIRHEKKLREE